MFGNAHAFLTYEKEAHMKPIRRTAVCTMFFLAMLGAAFAQHVQTDFDHQANFSQYKTYSWQEIKPANSLWDARIKNAVDAELEAKGWAQGGGGGVGDPTTTEQDYKVGALVIDLYDAKTKQLIWRGSAQDTLSDKATQNEKNLAKAVAKMFKAFPPESAKS